LRRRWSLARSLRRSPARLGSIPANYFAGASSSVSGRKFRRPFDPVAITPAPEATPLPPVAERAGVIEIEFATGGRMRITGVVDALTVAALMKALAKGKRRR
jgi:hypothetical protein